MSIFSIQRILVFLLMMLPFEAAASTRHALLIGNSRYEVAAPLRNPENDIEIVGAALEKSGFAVTRVANAKAVDTLAAVDAFVARLTTVESPIVMVYFAGHGIQVAGENYLLPVDAKLGSEEELRSIALSLGDLTRRLDAVRSSLQIVVLDSCRDNPFEQTRGLRRGLATAPERLGRIVAFSTSPGNVATDGDTGASPYATALAESVTIPGLSIEDVFKRVRATVQERTGGKQEPWENSAVYGDFQFTEGKPAEAGGDEVAFFEFAALADSQEAYQKYLSRYPQGMFASLAKQKIEFMDKDFSFRKQSETFRYVTFENNHEDRCGKMRFNKSEEKMRHVLADGEVVLMRLEFWVPYEACPQTSYYLRTQEKKPENDSIYSANMAGTDIFASSHLEITADQERRINEAFSSKARVAWGMSGSRGWGQPADYQLQARFQTSSGGMGVAVRKPGDAAKADIIEYGCEDNCIIFQALVRVYDRTGPDEAADGAEEYEIDCKRAFPCALTRPL